jgi:MFS family permease
VFGALERIAAPERLTEGLAWISTGLNLGAGLAAPAVGAVADVAGARQALLIPVAASIPTGVLAVLVARRVAVRTGTSGRPEHLDQPSPHMW